MPVVSAGAMGQEDRDDIFCYWVGPRENGATNLVADEAQGKVYLGR